MTSEQFSIFMNFHLFCKFIDLCMFIDLNNALVQTYVNKHFNFLSSFDKINLHNSRSIELSKKISYFFTKTTHSDDKLFQRTVNLGKYVFFPRRPFERLHLNIMKFVQFFIYLILFFLLFLLKILFAVVRSIWVTTGRISQASPSITSYTRIV